MYWKICSDDWFEASEEHLKGLLVACVAWMSD